MELGRWIGGCSHAWKSSNVEFNGKVEYVNIRDKSANKFSYSLRETRDSVDQRLTGIVQVIYFTVIKTCHPMQRYG